MAQLNLRLTDDQADALRKYAARRRTPVAWLLKDYIDYLLNGGRPVSSVDDDIPSAALTDLAHAGGAFDWLAEEPELYSTADGEAV